MCDLFPRKFAVIYIIPLKKGAGIVKNSTAKGADATLNAGFSDASFNELSGWFGVL